MQTLDEQNCEDYLRGTGLIGRDERLHVRLLEGGVSNVVFYVQREKGRAGQGSAAQPSGDDFVLKQARGQLRVEQPWFCSVERIWREVEVLRICDSLLSGHSSIRAARVLLEDRENYAFAMTAAPPEHRTWKSMLLAGEFSHQIATACGELLGRLHAETWNDQQLAEQIGDRQYFVDLRVDPYYRRIAEVHTNLQAEIDALIDSLAAHPRCLVHGDFSPKNLLVWPCSREGFPTVMLVDCEVGHFGDPAFDLGFFLTHLVLKGVYHMPRHAGPLGLAEAFWQAYVRILPPRISPSEFDVLQHRAIANLGGCLLARVDGKSPVEYLAADVQQQIVRDLGRMLLVRPPATILQATEQIRGMLSQGQDSEHVATQRHDSEDGACR